VITRRMGASKLSLEEDMLRIAVLETVAGDKSSAKN